MRRKKTKKNRIVIKGIKWKKERLKQKVIKFIKDSTKINIGIKKT